MMYQQFFGFKEPPFNLTPDSKFLFLSHRHQEALAAMLFGVQERKGFICLTGEIGCGKTTLCRALLSQLDPEKVKVCMVLNSYLTDLELLKTINEGFGLRSDSESKKTLLDALNDFLVDEFSKGHNIVLVIDESQNLRPETLEQVRMISNLETETDKLIQIMLIGQPELRRTLNLPELEQLNQRITVRYHINPLEEKEVSDYIRHRLSVAEPQVEIEFTPQAHRLIHHYSRGVPRRINVICDRCLLIAYTQGTFTIDDKIVQQAVDEVRGDTGHGPVSTTGIGGSRGGGLRRVAAAVGQGVFAICVLALGVWLGLFFFNRHVQNEDDAGARMAAKTAAPRTGFPEANLPLPVETSPATEATPVLTATPVPTPSPTPFLYENWQEDTEKVLRVRDNRLAEAASYLNLMRLWAIEINLELFRDVPPAEVEQYDLPTTFRNDLNFHTYHADDLTTALRLDLPVLVELGGAEFGRWCVVAAMRGEMLTLIDPVNGRRTVRKSKIEPLVTQSLVLYRDNAGFTGIGSGEQSDRVQILQQWLANEGFYEGRADGKFGPGTREALRRLQEKNGLRATGELDPPTLAWISNQDNPRRPRLYT